MTQTQHDQERLAEGRRFVGIALVPARRGVIERALGRVVELGGTGVLITTDGTTASTFDGVEVIDLQADERLRSLRGVPGLGRAYAAGRPYLWWRLLSKHLDAVRPAEVTDLVLSGLDAWPTAWHLIQLQPDAQTCWDVPEEWRDARWAPPPPPQPRRDVRVAVVGSAASTALVADCLDPAGTWTHASASDIDAALTAVTAADPEVIVLDVVDDDADADALVAGADRWLETFGEATFVLHQAWHGGLDDDGAAQADLDHDAMAANAELSRRYAALRRAFGSRLRVIEPHGADGPDRLLAVLPRVAPPTPPTPPSAPRPAAKPSLYRRARRKAGKLVKKLTGRTVRWPGLRRR